MTDASGTLADPNPDLRPPRRMRKARRPKIAMTVAQQIVAEIATRG